MVGVYRFEISALEKIISEWLLPRVTEERRELAREFAKYMATWLWLSAEYGAGDALAGYIIMMKCARTDVAKEIEGVRKILRKLGVKKLPDIKVTEYVTFWIFWDKVAKEADFGDWTINNALRELHEMAASGGRYRSSWLKGKGGESK